MLLNVWEVFNRFTKCKCEAICEHILGKNIIMEEKEENGKSNKRDIEHTVCFLKEVLYYLEWFEFYSVLFKTLKLPFI